MTTESGSPILQPASAHIPKRISQLQQPNLASDRSLQPLFSFFPPLSPIAENPGGGSAWRETPSPKTRSSARNAPTGLLSQTSFPAAKTVFPDPIRHEHAHIRNFFPARTWQETRVRASLAACFPVVSTNKGAIKAVCTQIDG